MDEATLDRIQDAIAKTVTELGPSDVSPPVTIGAFHRAVDKKLRAEDRARMNKGRVSDVDAALDRYTGALAQALREAGMQPSVVTLLQSWVTIQLEARALHHQAMTLLLAEIAMWSPVLRANTARTWRTRITTRGQITLKKEALHHLGVAPGARVELSLLPEGRVEFRAAPEASSRG